MKILPKHTTGRALNFSARSKESKKADDIQRKTRENFPMLSPSYVERFYISAQYGAKNQERAREITRKMWKISCLNRNLSDGLRKLSILSGEEVHPLNDIDWVKNVKVGCCDESVDAALAVLFANGYYNASSAQLMCEIAFVDIMTKKEVFKTQNSIKHCFVTAGFDEVQKEPKPPLDKNVPLVAEFPLDASFEDLSEVFGIRLFQDDEKESGQNFVIDPWLSFADYKGAAVSRYKQVFSNEIEEFKNLSILRFMEILEEKGLNENALEDYNMLVSFKFKNISSKTLKEKQAIGEAVRNAYRGVVLNETPKAPVLDINV